jgi:hypothetical protein
MLRESLERREVSISSIGRLPVKGCLPEGSILGALLRKPVAVQSRTPSTTATKPCVAGTASRLLGAPRLRPERLFGCRKPSPGAVLAASRAPGGRGVAEAAPPAPLTWYQSEGHILTHSFEFDSSRHVGFRAW